MSAKPQTGPLHERHEQAGATLGEISGWSLPVSFTSAEDEHRAVRESAGAFDLCHLGQLAINWSWAQEYLQARLTNDVDRLEPWTCQYTLATNEDGGVVDDLILFRLPKGFLLTVNAQNVEPDLSLLSELSDVSADWGLLAVQGPTALSQLGIEVERSTFRREAVLGVECLVSGTGYTGESGCELLCNAEDVGALWDNLMETGIPPCGMAARDSLRIEYGLVRHGHELSTDHNPYEAGLERLVKTSKNFVGVGPLRRIKRDSVERRLVAFVMEDDTVPDSGAEIDGGGQVTSAAYSPMLEHGIGLAYVWPGVSDPGTPLAIETAQGTSAARIHALPLLGEEGAARKRGRVRRLKASRPPRGRRRARRN